MAPEVDCKDVFVSNILYSTTTDVSSEGLLLRTVKAQNQGSSPMQCDFENKRRPRRESDRNNGCRNMDSTVLSDKNLASRKAEEAANRRYHASSWLQQMVGPLELPMEPSEEELRLCLQNGLTLCRLINKVHPGAVPKIVENAVPSSPMEGVLLAFQYFENVRNFLVAIEDLKLPSFEASDLEQSSLLTGTVAKVVDCILAIKAFYDWKQSGGAAPWKVGVPLKSPGGANMCSQAHFVNGCSDLTPPNSTNLKYVIQPKKRWAHSDSEHLKEMHLPADSTSTWISEIGLKISDVFGLEKLTDDEGHVLDFHDAKNGQKCTLPQPLLNLVRTVLGDKKPEEIPKLVEFMLRKVMEEFERRIALQGEQVKMLENTLEDVHKQGQPSQRLQGPGSSSLEHGLKVYVDQLQQVKRLKVASESTRQDVLKLQVLWNQETQNLDNHLRKLATAAVGYQKVLEENRQLYNQVQDLKGNIRVYCRVRPFLNAEAGRQGTVDYIGENGEIMIINPKKQGKDVRKSFIFNKVFGTSASQEEVFLDTQPLIRSVLDGYNVCIFAYGQTGSGKTYTMNGPDSGSEYWGVNYRALNDLFHISQMRKDVLTYDVGVQMIEIYNEQVRDLLVTNGASKKLEIRNNSQQNGVNVPDANMLSVNCTSDVLDVMKTGHRNRAVGSTALNDRSSRSHSVLTVHVRGMEMSSGAILHGCLHLVDLAGSERVDKSEATGDRLKEAQHINKSLSALGDVISALIQKSSHVPYRNSKLTQLLQDALGGQAKTLMFVHVNPDPESYGETISTLKFAERVASVELGAAHSNKECREVRDLKEQITCLKDALAKKDAEIERLNSLKSIKARSPQVGGPDKQKCMQQRIGGEEQKLSDGRLLREGADTLLDPLAEKFAPQMSIGPPPACHLQGLSSEKQISIKTKEQSLRVKKSCLVSCGPLSSGAFVHMKHYKHKFPWELESCSISESHLKKLEHSARPSIPGTELGDDELPELWVDSKLSKKGVPPDTGDSLVLSKHKGRRAFALNTKESALEINVSISDVLLDCPLADVDGFSKTADGQSNISGNVNRYINSENQAITKTFEGCDGTESRKHYGAPENIASVDQGDNVFQIKKSPLKTKQALQTQRRSPLQVQKPKNERRLSNGVQSPSPLRRSLDFGTFVTPGVNCFGRRASLAGKASFDFSGAALVAALDLSGKGEVCQQLLVAQTKTSPKSSRRWV